MQVIEFTDPGCIWSWVFEPVRCRVRQYCGTRVGWRRVMGIALDGNAPGEPGHLRGGDAEPLRGWRQIARLTRSPITRELAWIHGTTRVASAAVKASELQGDTVAERVLLRLRQSFFLDGRPPDTDARVALALRAVLGLHLERLLDDMRSPSVLATVEEDWQEARRPCTDVPHLAGREPYPGRFVTEGEHVRYAFPSLLISGPGGTQVISGWQPFAVYASALRALGAAPAERTPVAVAAVGSTP